MKKLPIILVVLLPVIFISFRPGGEMNNKIELPGRTEHIPGYTPGFHNHSATPAFSPSPAKFNAVLFESLVNEKMKNTVKGYAIAIADKEGIKGRAAGGWAQDPADGNVKMTTKTPSCIGSVSKMLSCAALLNLLEAMPEVKLDDPVFPKLPKRWQQEYKGTAAECITYRQLMQHKSSFRYAGKTGIIKNLDSLKAFSKKCPFSAPRFYCNANISLLRFLITALAYPQEAEAIEKMVANLSFDDYSAQVIIDYSDPYERYIRKFILEKGLTSIVATCGADPALADKVAKEYSSLDDTKGTMINAGHCAPQGSWYLSAEMLAHFGRTLLYSNNYLTNTTKNMLFDTDNTDDRIAWNGFKNHTAFGKETGQANWPMHDGDQNGYSALLLQLPYGYVGAIVVNTDLSPSKMASVIMDAFYEATHSGTSAEIAKHGIPEKSYQEEFSIIWNSGYYPVWVDAYDVNGKTFFNTIFRPNNSNYDVKVRHNMTKEGFQLEYNEWVKQKNYRLQQLESYNDAGKLKFAAIFINKPERDRPQPAYHALSQEEHQTLFEKYSGHGYVPVNVSVVSVAGKKYYSAFYEKRNVGGHVLKSTLTQQEYQTMYEDMNKKNWEQVYINAYEHNNQTYFSVIWHEKSGYKDYTAIRRGSSDVYQEKWETHTGNGFHTRCVTGYEEGGKHWFAAHWSK